MSRMWRNNAIARIKADEHRSGGTNLLRVWFPKVPGIDLYLKDESNHKTGSLKHRLSTASYASCSGAEIPSKLSAEPPRSVPQTRPFPSLARASRMDRRQSLTYAQSGQRRRRRRQEAGGGWRESKEIEPGLTHRPQ